MMAIDLLILNYPIHHIIHDSSLNFFIENDLIGYHF